MTSDEAAAAVRRHMKAADTEVTELNKLRKKRLKAAREAARAREASNPNAPSTSNQPPAPLLLWIHLVQSQKGAAVAGSSNQPWNYTLRKRTSAAFVNQSITLLRRA